MSNDIPHKHFAMFKPYGYLSQLIDNSSTKTKLLGQLYSFPPGVMAIGRLDQDSEGLLLLTTDGAESERVRGKDIEKEYWALVDGTVTDKDLDKIRNGIFVPNGANSFESLPCKAEIIENEPLLPPRPKPIRDSRHGPVTWISISLRQGKYRQVRKMTAAAGFPTLRLVRVRIGSFSIGKLVPGQVLELGSIEV
jgi:23S rRNA pseudouridine2457 synthase